MIMKDKLLTNMLVGLELILGGVFIYSGLMKLFNLEGFVIVVANYKLIPTIFIKPFAYLLPFIELGFGTMFLLGMRYRIVRHTLSGLLIIFIIALTVNLIRGINVECGCFSVISDQKSKSSEMILFIIRDIVFLSMFIIYNFYLKKEKNL